MKSRTLVEDHGENQSDESQRNKPQGEGEVPGERRDDDLPRQFEYALQPRGGR